MEFFAGLGSARSAQSSLGIRDHLVVWLSNGPPGDDEALEQITVALRRFGIQMVHQEMMEALEQVTVAFRGEFALHAPCALLPY